MFKNNGVQRYSLVRKLCQLSCNLMWCVCLMEPGDATAFIGENRVMFLRIIKTWLHWNYLRMLMRVQSISDSYDYRLAGLHSMTSHRISIRDEQSYRRTINVRFHLVITIVRLNIWLLNADFFLSPCNNSFYPNLRSNCFKTKSIR